METSLETTPKTIKKSWKDVRIKSWRAFVMWLQDKISDVEVKRDIAAEDGNENEVSDCELVIDTLTIVKNKIEQ